MKRTIPTMVGDLYIVPEDGAFRVYEVTKQRVLLAGTKVLPLPGEDTVHFVPAEAVGPEIWPMIGQVYPTLQAVADEMLKLQPNVASRAMAEANQRIAWLEAGRNQRG